MPPRRLPIPPPGRRLAALALLAVTLPVLLGGLWRPGAAWQGQAAAPTPGSALAALEAALEEVGALRERVEAGELVPDFGERARAVLAEARARGAPELERAVEGALRGLFLRQAALLAARQAAGSAAAGGAPEKGRAAALGGRAALAEAERVFLEEAAPLAAPGSGWSAQPGLGALRQGLGQRLRREAALAEERARAARAQRATIGAIARLQEQMEQLQQKAQGARGGGSPWVLSTSYRLPNTPLQLAGRYEQGRANLELSLTPDRNTDTDAGFIDGIGPANLGISFNLGI